jgi:hypothetical protein
MSNFSDRDFPALPSAKAESHRNSGTMTRNKGGHVAARAFATINDLPEELLLGILHYLPGIDMEDFQLSSLVSLSRTNRRFRRLVIGKIYASYNSHFCEPYLFLRTVINNSNFANLVKHADFTYGIWAHRERQRYTANAQDKKVVKEGLKALGISDWKNLATQCNTDSVELDTLYTAILMQIPNISSLIIRDGQMKIMGSMSPKWIDLIRKANLGSSDLGRVHRFKHLQTLRVEIHELTLTSLAPIFRIPSLRKLYLKGLFEDEDGRNRAEQTLQYIIPQGCNSLEELHVEHGFLQNDILRVVLASARSLKAFSYDLLVDSLQYYIEEEDLGSTTLMAALRCQQTTLESLSFTNDPDAEERLYSVTNLFEGLKEFSAMKHLSCSLGSMLDENEREDMTLAEKLPPSLTTFRATMDTSSENQIRGLEQLASYSFTHIPLLSQVRIESELLFTYDWSRLVAAYSRTDINFAIEALDEDESSFYSPIPDGVPALSDTESSESSGEVSLYSD